MKACCRKKNVPPVAQRIVSLVDITDVQGPGGFGGWSGYEDTSLSGGDDDFGSVSLVSGDPIPLASFKSQTGEGQETILQLKGNYTYAAGYGNIEIWDNTGVLRQTIVHGNIQYDEVHDVTYTDYMSSLNNLFDGTTGTTRWTIKIFLSVDAGLNLEMSYINNSSQTILMDTSTVQFRDSSDVLIQNLTTNTIGVINHTTTTGDFILRVDMTEIPSSEFCPSAGPAWTKVGGYPSGYWERAITISPITNLFSGLQGVHHYNCF